MNHGFVLKRIYFKFELFRSFVSFECYGMFNFSAPTIHQTNR